MAGTYLLNDEDQVLLPTLFLVPNSLKADLAALLETRLDRHLQDGIGSRPLARLVEHLALDLHLLGHAIEQVLQRERQRSLHGGDLGSRLPGIPHGLSTERVAHPRAAAAGTPTAKRAREDVVEVVIGPASARRGRPHELGEDVVRVAEAESSVAAVGAEVEGPTAAGARHAAKVESAKSAGHAAASATGEGMATGAGLWGRSATPQDEFEPELVVCLAFLGIRENLICLGALLEFLSRIGIVLVLVGMEFQSRFPRVGGIKMVSKIGSKRKEMVSGDL